MGWLCWISISREEEEVKKESNRRDGHAQLLWELVCCVCVCVCVESKGEKNKEREIEETSAATN